MTDRINANQYFVFIFEGLLRCVLNRVYLRLLSFSPWERVGVRACGYI